MKMQVVNEIAEVQKTFMSPARVRADLENLELRVSVACDTN